MTPDLDAIRKRCDAATQGPWKTAINDMRDDGRVFVVRDVLPEAYPGVTDLHGGPIMQLPPPVFPCDVRAEDGDFIAAAREDVPALLDKVERLQEALGRILELPALALDSEAGSRADDIVQEALKEDTP